MATMDVYLSGLICLLLLVIAGLLIYRFFFIRRDPADPENPGLPLYPLDPSSPLLYEKTRTVTITTNDEVEQVVPYPEGITNPTVRAIHLSPFQNIDDPELTLVPYVMVKNAEGDGKSWKMGKMNILGEPFKLEGYRINVTYVLGLE